MHPSTVEYMQIYVFKFHMALVMTNVASATRQMRSMSSSCTRASGEPLNFSLTCWHRFRIGWPVIFCPFCRDALYAVSAPYPFSYSIINLQSCRAPAAPTSVPTILWHGKGLHYQLPGGSLDRTEADVCALSQTNMKQAKGSPKDQCD